MREVSARFAYGATPTGAFPGLVIEDLCLGAAIDAWEARLNIHYFSP
jgi:hypothetical protein